MASRIIPRPAHDFNTTEAQANREEAIRIAFERLNAMSPADMLNADIFTDATGMTDPGPDFTPRPWR